ncbi:MBOAT-domain-containing protein [Fistulina hepatica ATCC 64428]|uniref:MBOAT-domain-containing protein n=1 Tax=Fistulina hepatica ATCC 64428 TaxID=1128425 RepID=A0A0D7A4N6_9AGAR|nr:MBOAT-domain-containing protein [Fistulina hepatica ATCC 64428]
MDAVFVPLADAVGASVDQVKLIFCLLIAYPLGSVFIRMPSSVTNSRHFFNIAIASFFFFPVLGIYSAFFQLLADILVTYFITKHVRSAAMPWIVFALVMGHLTVNHAIRVIFNLSYETIEITGPQMVLTMKLTTFAWNVHDGRRPAEDLDKWQSARRITEFPSLTAFLGYSLYFPGVLVGPYLDYSEYDALVTEKLFDGVETKGNRKIPSGRKRVAYMRMLLGLFYLGIFVLFGPSYNYHVGLTPWFLEQNLFKRIAFFQLFGVVERTKYYAIWTLTEGASILTGLGFTGFGPKGETKWDGASNIVAKEVELPTNFKGLLDHWNMKTNIWLRECIYKRVTPKGKKPGFKSSMLTSLTSAFWHGVSTGYYLTFVTGAFITTVARLVRANVRPLFLPAEGQPPSVWKRAYDILGTVVCVLILNYAASPFMLLTVSASVQVWSALKFYGHVMIFGALLFFYAGGKKLFRGLQMKTGKTAPAKLTRLKTEPNLTVPPPLNGFVPPSRN